MSKHQLLQIKTFRITNFDTPELLDKSVNDYVIEVFNKQGNYPKIETNSKFISVICEHLVETNRELRRLP